MPNIGPACRAFSMRAIASPPVISFAWVIAALLSARPRSAGIPEAALARRSGRTAGCEWRHGLSTRASLARRRHLRRGRGLWTTADGCDCGPGEDHVGGASVRRRATLSTVILGFVPRIQPSAGEKRWH